MQANTQVNLLHAPTHGREPVSYVRAAPSNHVPTSNLWIIIILIFAKELYTLVLIA